MAALTKPNDDFRARADRDIQRAGLTDDPYGPLYRNQVEIHEEQKELVAAVRSLVQQKPPPLTRGQIRSAITPEVLREMARWGVAFLLAGIVCGASAGWFAGAWHYDGRCRSVYSADTCDKITR